jgi:outer membrane protein TolC
MTHPVTCLVGRGFESCPNRFSERELRTMGFTEIPAPPPDPCITQKNVLVSSLAGQRSTIDAQRAQLADLERQLNAIKAQYPTLVLPPSVFTTYTSLVDRYNALLVGTNANVSAYNVTTQQLNALPC